MARREKRLEKKKAKRAEKKKERSRIGAMGVAERMSRAASAPVLDCFVSDDGDEQGIMQLVLSRQLANGDVAAAILLIDRFCLGLKDGFGRVLPLGDYRQMARKLSDRSPMKPLDPPSARRLVEDAIAYARRYGFEPHPDARKALPLFGDIDPARAARTFEFGREGKPFYICGPHESMARQRQIYETLVRTAGVGNFDFLMAAGPEIAEEFDALDDEDLESYVEDEEDWSDDEGDEADDLGGVINFRTGPRPLAFRPPEQRSSREF